MRRGPVTTALIGAAALSGLAGAVAGTLRWQAVRLRRHFDAEAPSAPARAVASVVPAPDADPAEARSVRVRSGADSELPAALLVIGDSWVLDPSGGVDVAGLLGTGLARLTGRSVLTASAASPGARADDIVDQLEAVLDSPAAQRRTSGGARFAVISMGTGDVIHPVTGSVTLGVLTAALSALQRRGFTAVVLCCPNLGSLPGARNPLRTVLRRSSRVLGGSQWLTAVAAQAHPVSLNDTLSGTRRGDLIGASGLTPSALGYRQVAAVCLSRIAEITGAEIASAPSEDPSAALLDEETR